MSEEEIIIAASQVEGISGMTVNERLYVSGLLEEFDKAMITDKSKAKIILEALQVDAPSINEIVQ